MKYINYTGTRYGNLTDRERLQEAISYLHAVLPDKVGRITGVRTYTIADSSISEFRPSHIYMDRNPVNK